MAKKNFNRAEIKRTEKVLNDLLEIDKRSPKTVKGYRNVYYQYEDFLSGKAPTLENVKEFLKTKAHLTTSTVSTYRMALRTYFKKLGIEIPRGELKPLKFNNIREDKFVTRKEVDTLYRCADRLRDKVAIRLLYHAGLRSTELLNLDVGNLDLQNERINVPSIKEGRKIRRVRLIRPELVIPTVRSFLEQRGINPDKPTKEQLKEPLIKGYKGRLTYKQLWENIQKLGPTIGKPDLSPHWLRHGFAVWNKVHGAGVEVCAMQMGDTPETVAKIYSHFSESDIDREYDQIQGRISGDKPANKNPIDEIDELKADNNNLRMELEELKTQQNIVMKVLAKEGLIT